MCKTSNNNNHYPIRNFFQNPETHAPTKKAVGISITLIAVGAIGAFIGTMMYLAAVHNLPHLLSFFSPLGGIPPYWGIIGGSAGGALFLTGVVMVLALAISNHKKKKAKEKEPVLEMNFAPFQSNSSLVEPPKQQVITSSPSSPQEEDYPLLKDTFEAEALSKFLRADEYTICRLNDQGAETFCAIIIKENENPLLVQENTAENLKLKLKGRIFLNNEVQLSTVQRRKEEVEQRIESLNPLEFFLYTETNAYYGTCPPERHSSSTVLFTLLAERSHVKVKKSYWRLSSLTNSVDNIVEQGWTYLNDN